MKKRVLSMLMALVLCLTLLPTAALADELGPVDGTSTVETAGADAEAEAKAKAGAEAVAAVQAMIDALPDALTEENAGDVSAMLGKIDAAMAALGDEERAALDLTQYQAVIAALAALAAAQGEIALYADENNKPKGEGTEAHPYQITSNKELEWFRDTVNAGKTGICAELMDTLNFKDENGWTWTPIGKDASKAYTGTFNGNGYKISMKYAVAPDGMTAGWGLFGSIGNDGKVQDLDIYLTNFGRDGKAFSISKSGMLAAYNSGTIERCTATSGKIYVSSGVGLLVYRNNGTIQDCLTKLNSNCIGEGGTLIGGVAYTNNGKIKNCFFNGGYQRNYSNNHTITFEEGNSGSIENCYFISGRNYTDSTKGVMGVEQKDANSGKLTFLLNNDGKESGNKVDPWRIDRETGGYPSLKKTDYRVSRKENGGYDIGDKPHMHGNVEFTKVTALSDITADGNYYISGEIALDSTWEVDKEILLCLDGQTITATSGVDPAIKISSGGSLTLVDGSKSGGGKITGGATGVMLDGGAFTMQGGEISGNTVGVHVQSGKLTLGGKAKITDNSAADAGVKQNILLAQGSEISFDSLDPSAKFGISVKGQENLKDGERVAVTDTTGGRYFAQLVADGFKNDGSGFELYLSDDGDKVMLGKQSVHKHCICGGGNTNLGHDTHSDITFQPWTETDKLPTSGNYYLTRNVTLAGNASPQGANVCLNGYTVTLSDVGRINPSGTTQLTDCSVNGKLESYPGKANGGVTISGGSKFYLYGGTLNGVKVEIGQTGGGTFNMYGGKITGNTKGTVVGQDSQKIYINMYGGEISGNHIVDQYGGGVFVGNGNQFNMYGGTIRNNSAVDGGGVYIAPKGPAYQAGTMTIRGDAVIQDNKANGVTNNVSLPKGSTIKIDGKMDESAQIGVTTKAGPSDIATATGEGWVAAKNFTSDNSAYHVGLVNDGKTVQLQVHSHQWEYSSQDGTTITAKCTAGNCDLENGNGGSVQIVAPSGPLIYDGAEKTATVNISRDWQGEAVDASKIVYTKEGDATFTGNPKDAGTYTASITVGGVTASVKYTIQKANPVVTKWPTLSASVYVNSEATLTGGSGVGTFAFKAGAAKSWDSAGSKTTTIVFTPTDTNNYKELTQDYTVTVVKRTVKNCNTLTGITDKPYGTALEELGLPETVTITTEDGKTFDKIPVTWSGYNPNTLEEQTLTGTLNLTSIANEVEQPGTPVTAQIKVKLTQKSFSGISAAAYEGVYDGSPHGITLTGVPSGAIVKYGESADSCTQDSLTYTDFTDGAKTVYYKVSQPGYTDASGSATVNITKRPLTVSSITENKTYAYASGSDDKAIGVDIAGKLPPDRGTTIYTVAKKDPEQLLSEVTVDTAGNLTYKVNQVDSSKVGKTVIITVTASMENYENVEYTLTINITDKKTVEIKRGNTVSVDGSNALTYGEKVSKLTLGNTVFVETGTDDMIEGILSWSNPDEIPAAGTTQAGWVFKPADSTHYAELTGTAAITVAKATPIVVTVPTVAERGYNPDAALTSSDITGGSVTGVDGNSLAGTWNFTGTNIIPTVNNKGYQAVFTPDDTNNYNTVTRTITVTVNKAAKAPNMPEAAMTPAHSTKKVGNITLQEGWSWQEADKDTVLADGVTVTATAVYIGADKGNYETESVSITITRRECDHTHTEIRNQREATCTQTGYAGDTYCTDCDKLLSTGKELAALGHDYKVTVTKQPTTTEEGVRTYTCTRCNSSCTESIAKLPDEKHNHSYTGSITKEATCTEAGVRTYTCSCGDSYTEIIPATGHSYVSKVTKAATTTEEGIMTYTCSKCGHSYTQPIAKIKSDDSSEENGSQNQKPQTGTDNGNQNQKPQPDTDKGKDNGTSIKPYIKDDSGKKGWDVIKPQLEDTKAGDTVTVAMNGTTVVPKDVIDSIKGKDTTLVLDMGNGLSWKIYGKDITDASGDIDFDVTVGADAGKSIPVDVINNVTGERYSINLTLAYDGEFGFTATLTVNMESKNAGLYANLFYYNEQTGELEFISAGQIDPDGNVELVFTHASDYTIVVDARIMSDNGQADNKADETIPAPKTGDSISKYAWNNTIIIIIDICIILIVFGAVFYVRKKSGSEEK